MIFDLLLEFLMCGFVFWSDHLLLQKELSDLDKQMGRFRVARVVIYGVWLGFLVIMVMVIGITLLAAFSKTLDMGILFLILPIEIGLTSYVIVKVYRYTKSLISSREKKTSL